MKQHNTITTRNVKHRVSSTHAHFDTQNKEVIYMLEDFNSYKAKERGKSDNPKVYLLLGKRNDADVQAIFQALGTDSNVVVANIVKNLILAIANSTHKIVKVTK